MINSLKYLKENNSVFYIMSEDKSALSVKPANYRLPNESTLQHAAKLAIVEDKPIMLDYWTSSLQKEQDKERCLIGVKSKTEKLLVKNEEEYTSPITKFYKNDKDFIVVTENSIYLVSADIPTRMIS